MELNLHAPHIDLPHGPLEEQVQHALERFADRLTRVEVFIKDLNADKGGVDKRCVIEARPSGQDPVAVEHDAEGIGEAVGGAAKKLQRLLDHKFGKQGDHHPHG